MTTLQEKPAGKARTDTAGAHRTPSFRLHVVGAVLKRNLFSYFSNPAGYVFITLFVFVSAWAAFWQPAFFTNNLANLATLNAWMPYLLLFFIPAITMSAWAEERRQGTDELLLTLPARDLEVILGKYLAALAIYSVALLFSLSHVVILWWLGGPDYGAVVSTYFGYWLMGAMLIAVGMVASLLSSNVTVAFILGAIFCSIPIFFSMLGTLGGPSLRRQIEDLSIPAQFQDFGTGVIPWPGVFYFVSLACGMLYINMVLLSRRHWAGGERSRGLALHSAVRIVAVLIALASLNAMVGRSGLRTDLTQERVNSLSADSIALINQIPKDRPVYIQAYISPDVPREFIQTKADVVGLLKEYAARAGDRIRLNLIETELYSDAARDAEKRFGIEPRRVMTTDEARQVSAEFFLGVAFSSGLEEVVIPFFDLGLPVEYELTRSIRVVSRTSRKKIGILSTDAKLMGGFDMQSFQQTPEWSIVTELKKQYDVTSVSPDNEISSDVDVLLVAQPSSLTQKQIDNLTAYVRKGGPALLFLDPFPYENPKIAPEVPRMPAGGPFGGSPPPEPKGDLHPLLDLIGIDWPTNQIVWNTYNPHPQLAEMPPEIVFIGTGSGEEDAFNLKQPATSGLQQLVMLFSGYVRSKGGGDIDFIPLLRTNDLGGTVAWSDFAQQGMMGGFSLNPNRRHVATGKSYTLAARVKGTPARDDAAKKDQDKEKAKDKAKDQKAKQPEIHVIAVADLDLISEQFFMLRARKIENLDFDNITFVLNSVDVLAGDESFVALRKRRLKHRTLVTLEQQTEKYTEQRQKETKAAEDAADQQLKLAQERLDKQVAALRDRKDVDDRTKEIMLASLQSAAQRRLDVEKTVIEDQKRRKVQESKADMERRVRDIENRIRMMAIIFPPLPTLFLGLLVFGVRVSRENQGANPNRLA